jgi:SNF2 family DNA or RNA helicase
VIHVSAKHRVVGVPFRADLANLFPGAQTVEMDDDRLILLPHGMAETRLLRNLGLDVPAPILTQYDWEGGTPFDVQKKTAALLTTNFRAYCLNGMGTGKTKASLWAWRYLNRMGLANKLLVVAPLSTLNFTWMREVFNTLPGISATVLHGTRAKRLARLADTSFDVYIVNHDGLGVIWNDLKTRTDIDTMVLDELAVYRNGTSDRTKLARDVAKRMRWCWGMTGSPTPQAPTDAWGQCSIITPHTVPRFFGRFRDEVMTKVSQFRFVPKNNALDRVWEVMQPAVRFVLDDVVELPDVVERTVDIDLGPKQAKAYKALEEHAHALIANQEITAANAGAVLMKLLQVSSGYVYTRDRTIVSLDNDERLQALVDAVLSTDRKVLVFVPFKHALDGIIERLTREGIETAKVSGDTPRGERDQIFNLFQNTNRFRVIAAHPACMSHGLTLTAADSVVWFAPITSLETFEQANARIRRIGQKSKQQILMFQSTKVERQIYTKLRAKQRVQDRLLEMFADSSE